MSKVLQAQALAVDPAIGMGFVVPTASPPLPTPPPAASLFYQQTLDEADAIAALRTREERLAWAAARGRGA